jgi:hypothetical protein
VWASGWRCVKLRVHAYHRVFVSLQGLDDSADLVSDVDQVGFSLVDLLHFVVEGEGLEGETSKYVQWLGNATEYSGGPSICEMISPYQDTGCYG